MKSSKAKELDFNYFNERFAVAIPPDDYLGEWSGLVRKTEIRTGKYNHLLIPSGVMAGNVATDTSGRRCWRVGSDYVCYYVHRIVWLLSYGKIDSNLVIDHKNGNALDNSIDNLRIVEIVANQRNRKQDSRNSSGVTGVSWKIGAVSSSYYDNKGVRHIKYFSIRKLGILEAFASACSHREKMIKSIQENEYTDRHGIPE